MERIKALAILTTLIIILGVACEKAESISGDSKLKIINDCSTSVRIYFDGNYIGKVNSEDNETWSVPSGSHEIKATSSFHKDFKQTYNFVTGVTRTIRLDISIEKEFIMQSTFKGQ